MYYVIMLMHFDNNLFSNLLVCIYFHQININHYKTCIPKQENFTFEDNCTLLTVSSYNTKLTY